MFKGQANYKHFNLGHTFSLVGDKPYHFKLLVESPKPGPTGHFPKGWVVSSAEPTELKTPS